MVQAAVGEAGDAAEAEAAEAAAGAIEAKLHLLRHGKRGLLNRKTAFALIERDRSLNAWKRDLG